jgi:hypothetical protein
MKNTGNTIVASDGTTSVLSESSGTVTFDADVSTIGSATISGGSITGTEIDLKSSGTTIFASDGTTSVLSESGGVVTLTADTAIIEGSSSGDLVRITQTGTGNALVVEDSTNPDSTPFVVNASGSVGIGTNSTTEGKLCIDGGADGSSIISGRTDGGNGNNERFKITGFSHGGGAGYGGGIGFETRSTTNVFSESMRIDSSGNLLVGAQSSYTQYGLIQVRGDNQGIAIQDSTDNSYRAIYNQSGTLYFWNGSNEGYLNAAGAWTNSSDARLKTNVRDIEYGLNTILSSQPRHFERVDIDGTYIGFVAQELRQLVPEVVSGNPDKQLGVDYGSLVAIAFKAIQEQQTLIESQQSQIDALTTKTQEQDLTIASLISRIEALENA